ncbi:MAG TPA: hypothetical protein PKC80_02995 [Burkholderiaceae bacterium]|nr:hypothetical protein [Burkholderiaceae bacterium]
MTLALTPPTRRCAPVAARQTGGNCGFVDLTQIDAGGMPLSCALHKMAAG